MEEAKKNSILIIDDDVPNIRVLTDILGSEYTIYAAKDGLHAIKAAEERLPDLILLDILMPGMDGYEVIGEFKKSEATRAIPVIFITGLDSSEDEKRGLTLGAVDYISKPFSPEIVRLRVQNQLTIVNQMRALDKRFRQQTLMTSISQSFLTGEHLNSPFTNTLRMIGEFMEIAQVLLYKLNDENNTLVCRNEWLNPALNLKTHIGSALALEGPVISIVNSLAANGKNFCINSNDPEMKAVMTRYRTSFHDFITIPIYIKGKLEAAVDLSKEDDGQQWSESEINLAILAASIFSGVFERDEMEQIIRAKELAEQSDHAKREFLSRMSHEMRTPMNIIMGMTQLALNADDYEKKNVYLEKTDKASKRLLRLIDDILDLYEIGESKFVLICSDFNFRHILQLSLDSVCSEVSEKQQTLLTDIDPSIPETFIGDAKRLVQAIGNLLSNASKFTREQGSLQLNAAVCNIDNNTATIKIEVIDNGIGIPKHQLERLFLPFEQADGGIDRKFQGAGLGLSISKQIIERMGGEIWVESEPGKGSKFVFTVRLETKPPFVKDTKPASFTGKTILLAEDIEINREIMIAMLEDTQIQVTCAVNGREALEFFSSAPDKYNLIIMDINMPEMDGVEAVRHIRALELETQREQIPIIALTANVLSNEVEKYLAAGMNDHLGKPVDFEQLMGVLNKYLLSPL